MNLLKNSQTNWKYILIVVISAAIIGGGILWWTKTQEIPLIEFPLLQKPEKLVDETADWKTYQGDSWSVKLPPTYGTYEPTEKDESAVFVQKTFQGINIDDLPTNATGFSGLVFKKIQTKPGDISLFKHVQSLATRSRHYDEYFGNYIQSIEDPKEIEINGKSIIQTKLFCFESCPYYAYWLEKGPTEYIQLNVTKCFEIGGPFGINGLNKEQRQSIEKEVQKIISTFKFTELTLEPQNRYVKILSPNGGEQLTTGGKYVISWDAKNVEKIDILLAEGEDRTSYTDRLIANDFILTDENKYEWNVPVDLPPSKYVLLISSDDKQKWVKDFSDNYFTISGALYIQEKEKMLREMFKGEFTIEGNEIVSSALESYLHLYLEKVVESSFITPYAKEYLFIVQLSGVAHAGGLTHSFLGVFDGNKALSSPLVDIDTVADFSSEVHFGGDFVDFNFYSCKGITYTLVTSGGCPNGGVCSNSEISLLKVENGKFKVQDVFKTILDMKGYKGGPWPEFRIKTEEDKILVYDWKLVDYNFNCIAPNCIGEDEFGAGLRDDKEMMRLIYSGQLFWDNNDCKFVEELE